jgi:hypothetical protein
MSPPFPESFRDPPQGGKRINQQVIQTRSDYYSSIQR